MTLESILEWVTTLFEFLIIGFSLFFAWRIFQFAKSTGSGFSFKVREFVELSVNPSQVDLNGTQKLESTAPDDDTLPADYYYINHISFLREDKQEEFQRRTGLTDYPHYDIRIIVDSYYKDALDKVKYVEYFLHKSYPEPIQARSNRSNNFLLKELANGEYVLQAKVHITNRKEPLVLQRYITLGQASELTPN